MGAADGVVVVAKATEPGVLEIGKKVHRFEEGILTAGAEGSGPATPENSLIIATRIEK